MQTTAKGTVVVNARLDAELLRQLDELAESMQRTRSFLISQAVREFVEREFAHLVAVREGEADIEAGRSLTGAGMRSWLDDLQAGRTKQAPSLPKGGRRK